MMRARRHPRPALSPDSLHLSLSLLSIIKTLHESEIRNRSASVRVKFIHESFNCRLDYNRMSYETFDITSEKNISHNWIKQKPLILTRLLVYSPYRDKPEV